MLRVAATPHFLPVTWRNIYVTALNTNPQPLCFRRADHALLPQRLLSSWYARRARPGAGAAAPELTAASTACRGMATAPAPAPAEGPALPRFEHTPAPYDGPPKEEVLALRKRFLNPCAPALLTPGYILQHCC